MKFQNVALEEGFNILETKVESNHEAVLNLVKAKIFYEEGHEDSSLRGKGGRKAEDDVGYLGRQSVYGKSGFNLPNRCGVWSSAMNCAKCNRTYDALKYGFPDFKKHILQFDIVKGEKNVDFKEIEAIMRKVCLSKVENSFGVVHG
ncbi:hypothetical protein ACH5RR_002898 [Cinchona calisaya]|uniref:Uncharacterized protein n=1 Tax=Cinchona calisaya TaxID=153742 RepID=A0ABD3ATA3_9GENT